MRTFLPRDLRLSKLRYETLVIADNEYIKISRIAVMDLRLWLKEDLDLHTYHSFELHSNSLIGKHTIYAKYFLLLAINSHPS